MISLVRYTHMVFLGIFCGFEFGNYFLLRIASIQYLRKPVSFVTLSGNGNSYRI